MTEENPMDMSPQFLAAIEEVGRLCASAPDDVVQRWLYTQWIASMQTMPQLAAAGNSYPLLQHMGAIALTIERLGFEGHAAFLCVAADLMRAYHAIYNVTLNEPDVSADGATVH